ncbi:MAG: NrtA/SsuA/CpmA family ABC transporter substrate-binding protein [Casimicrobiaceae bacterium]
MVTRLRLILSMLLLACSLPVSGAEATKMTIATGVDPGFSIFYVAKLGGFLEKNGLDVDLRTGPSGGAMVPLLISNSSQASMSAAFAGISNHLKDPDIVAVAQMLRYDRWYGIVAKSDIKSLAELKGKKVGVSIGNASESYWYDALKHAKLEVADFKSAMVNVEAPEMVAAIERGNVQAFSAWEPWLSRTVLNVPNTRILVDDIGMVQDVGFIYMSRKWIEANRPTAVRFMRAMKEANDFINKEPEKTKEMVGKMLNLPKSLLDSMMPKVTFTLNLGPDSYAVTKRIVDQQITQGRLKQGQFDYSAWFYPELLRSVDPAAVNLPAKM